MDVSEAHNQHHRVPSKCSDIYDIFKNCALVIWRVSVWFEACDVWMQGSDFWLCLWGLLLEQWSGPRHLKSIEERSVSLRSPANAAQLTLSSLILWLDSQSSLLSPSHSFWVFLNPLKRKVHKKRQFCHILTHPCFNTRWPVWLAKGGYHVIFICYTYDAKYYDL